MLYIYWLYPENIPKVDLSRLKSIVLCGLLYSDFQLRLNFTCSLHNHGNSVSACTQKWRAGPASVDVFVGNKIWTRSAEPARKKAYSVDLQWWVVYQRVGMNLTYTQIAKKMSIASSTAQRVYKQFESEWDVDPVARSSRPELRTLDEQAEVIVIGLILESPSLYLNEVCRKVHDLTSPVVSPSCICWLI